MARYSSDSDSDHSSRYRRKRNRKSRSSSSDSSESSPHRRRSSKHSKTKRRHRSHSRSRGRDRNSKSHKGSRSSHSRDRDKKRYRSNTGRSYSSDRSRRKARSTSREKSRSPSSSSQSNQPKVNTEKSQTLSVKEDFPVELRFKDSVLEEINAEGFTPKQFTSSANKESKFKNIVIDISSDTIQIPVPNVPSGPESIFHTSIMMDQEARFDKWVKKLYTLRQKAIADLVHTNVI
ncbi:zinc finger Ran-binding domain-containing protein 2-like isoform X1 [Pogonomyrmex barbatus]|uniref:Zinc finger Ran-binding domain-containing protein 2-like isoform X1 n=1 Tax=Pogonomyrmex barbatus TaxID=144034 RepID=A0A6I9XMD7_9HYME|nr:zinc finger Ran-binding domain-containing protein 2-like isoform X1 [Pogonomyrmex barbatus]